MDARFHQLAEARDAKTGGQHLVLDTAAQAGGNAKPFAWFTAYAPADQPEIVVTAVMENAGEGSGFAAPLVRQVIEAYYGLPISPTPTDVRATD